MKKTLLLTLLFFVVLFTQAQTSFSLKAGVAFPQIEGDIFLGDKSLISIYPEVGASYKITDRIAISGGLGIKTVASTITGTGSGSGGYIDSNGDSITTYDTSGAVQDKTTLLYLTVPLYLSYIFDLRYRWHNLYIAFDLGYEPNINIYSKLGAQSTAMVLNPLVSDAIFGVRVGKTISRDQEIELGLRYCYAITELTKKLTGFPVSANAVILTVGLNFTR